MKNNQKFLILLIAVLLFSCNQEKIPKNTNNFSGLWKLYIMEQKDSISGEWKEWKNGMQGYILYDDKNNMAVHLTTKGYQNTNIRFPNFVDTISIEALKYLTNSYVYFGKYTVFEEDSTVEHARISHSNPGQYNQVVRRKYFFNGDTLTLQPVEKENARLRVKWVRSLETNKK